MICSITFQVGWGMDLIRLHWYECLQCSPLDRPARLFSLPEFRSLARCPDCGRQGLHVMETLERVSGPKGLLAKTGSSDTRLSCTSVQKQA